MRAVPKLAGALLLGPVLSACGSNDVGSEDDNCLTRVPQEEATLRAVVDPLIEPRSRDSMYYLNDCDSGGGAYVEWTVAGAATETVQKFERAGWNSLDSEDSDPTSADVRLARDVQDQTIHVLISCSNDGECDATAAVHAD